MQHFNMFGRKFRDEAGADGGDGGEGGTAPDSANTDQLAQLQAQIESQQAENQRLAAKLSEANKHAKNAEKAAAEEARKKAEADGNYEQLFKSSEQARQEWEEKYNGLQSTVQQKDIKEAALKMASTLAEGSNIELLAEFVERRLKFTDEGIKVTDESGNLTVSSLDDLSKEFSSSTRYASLIKGRQSSGGGASGGSSGSGAAKVISRSEFNALDPASRMKFTKDGGTVTDS